MIWYSSRNATYTVTTQTAMTILWMKMAICKLHYLGGPTPTFAWEHGHLMTPSDIRWSMNYFFFNRKLKRMIYFTVKSQRYKEDERKKEVLAKAGTLTHIFNPPPNTLAWSMHLPGTMKLILMMERRMMMTRGKLTCTIFGIPRWEEREREIAAHPLVSIDNDAMII